jgi:hypothetical protein
MVAFGPPVHRRPRSVSRIVAALLTAGAAGLAVVATFQPLLVIRHFLDDRLDMTSSITGWGGHDSPARSSGQNFGPTSGS